MKWREAQDISYSEVWESLNVSALEFRSWEIGSASPRCDRFYGVVKKLGSETYFEASMLINGLLLRKQELKQVSASMEVHRPEQDALGAVVRIAA